MTRQERNQTILAGLHPAFRPRVSAWLLDAESSGMAPLLTRGKATPKEQAAIYAQGRTTPGPIVTNAPPGSSYHELALAVDWVDEAASGVKDQYEPSDFEHTNYELGRSLGAVYGLQWGGMWRNNPDRPHFEYHPGYGPSEAKLLFAHADSAGNLPAEFFKNSDDVAV